MKKFTALFSVCISFVFSFTAYGENSISFERMWPGGACSWCLNAPRDITIDHLGNIYVLDAGNHRIQKYTDNFNFITSWGRAGTGRGEFVNPLYIAFHPKGYIYVSDSGYYAPTQEQVSRIQKFTLNGEWAGEINVYGDRNQEFTAPGGIAVDSQGCIYIADADIYADEKNNQIHKFTDQDQYIKTWPAVQVDTWTYQRIQDLAVEPDGSILAIFSGGSENPQGRKFYPVQRFSPQGLLIDKWAVSPEQEGTLYNDLYGICVDDDNHIYITMIYAGCIRVFSKNGSELESLGSNGTEDGQFTSIYGITVGDSGHIYAADADSHRIQKLSVTGEFLLSTGCSGSMPGLFLNPEKIHTADDNRIYVADASNNRIQIFEKNGTFFYEIPVSNYVVSVAVDHDGYMYTVHPWESYINKLSPNGSPVSTWPKAGDFSLDYPVDIAVSKENELYIADRGSSRIYRTTKEGELLNTWGIRGHEPGEFVDIKGIDIGPDGSVYVVDMGWYEPEIKDCPDAQFDPDASCGEEVARVQKFTPDGKFLLYWGKRGTRKSCFMDPHDVAVDPEGFVWVADTGNHRLQKFDENGFWVETFGEQGTEPGMFSGLKGVTFDKEGKLYTTEQGNSRIQVFDKTRNQNQKKDMAIIVAGGGPFPGNTLWTSTQICANTAYRTLLYQGYTRDRIFYLSWDTGLDLDGNTFPDDVDDVPGCENLKKALETWSFDAENLVIYLVDHGGFEQFRMGEQALMSVHEFKQWFETAHRRIPGKTILIYDACRSGSFLPVLASDEENPPVVIASTGADQSAYFTNNGTLSFSYQFWSAVQNGAKIMDAFISAKNAVEFTYHNQTPLLDDDGNGLGNENNDGRVSMTLTIGNATLSAGDIPSIERISPEITLEGQSSALISAENIIDADGIRRVWAVITPPDLLSGHPDNPVMTLPVVNFKKTRETEYQGQYNAFTAKGVYGVAVYAEDMLGEISLPLSTRVVQKKGNDSAVFSTDIFHLRLPCLKINDSCVEILLKLDMSKNTGIFYTLDTDSLNSTICTPGGSMLSHDFDIEVPRAFHANNAYSFTLKYMDDPETFLWEMDISSLKQLPPGTDKQ